MGKIKKTDDFFIRYLFGDNNNSDILLDFINSVMKDSNFNTFKSVNILNPFNLKENVIGKESILDIKATTEDGESVIIEVQTTGNRSFIKRSFYYAAKTYSNVISEGEDYNKLRAVISINLLNFNLDENTKAHTCYLLIEKDLGLLLTKDIEMHFLELLKCMETKNDIVKDLAVWSEFFTTDNLEAVMTKLINDKPIMEKVIKKYNNFTMDKDLMTEYDRHITYKLGYNLTMDEERRLGIEEGKTAIAKNMRDLNIDIDIIIKATGLSKDEIEKL